MIFFEKLLKLKNFIKYLESSKTCNGTLFKKMSTFVHFCPHHIENLKVDKNKSGQKWTKVDKSGQKQIKMSQKTPITILKRPFYHQNEVLSHLRWF